MCIIIIRGIGILYSNRHERRRAVALARLKQKNAKNIKRKMPKVLFNTVAAGLVGVSIQPTFAQSMNDECVISGDTATCSGDQSDGISNSSDFPAPEIDTLVINNLTSNIETDDDGVRFNIFRNGDININSDTGEYSIISDDGDGINARIFGDGNITIMSSGNISSEEEEGIDAEINGYGTVTINNSANIYSEDESIDATIQGGDELNANITTLNGAYERNIIITNSGSLYSEDSSNIDARIYDSGDITITNSGLLRNTYYGFGYSSSYDGAIRARTDSGNITIVNTGDDADIEDTYLPFFYDSKFSVITRGDGIIASTYSDGFISVQNSAGIISTSGGINTYSEDGDTTIMNTGDILTFNISGYDNLANSRDGFGINARSNTGDINITNSGDIGVLSLRSYIPVNLSGNENVINGLEGGITTGISARSYDGSDISISNTGNVFIANLNGYYGDIAISKELSFEGLGTSMGSNNAAGINVSTGDEGNVTIENSGDINMASGYVPVLLSENVRMTPYGSSGNAINARSFDGIITILNQGGLSLGSVGSGIHASSYYGNISILNGGEITRNMFAFPDVNRVSLESGVNGGDSAGIHAYTYGGNIVIANTGVIDLVPETLINSMQENQLYPYGYGNTGINVETSGNDGSIQVFNTGSIYGQDNGITIGMRYGNNASAMITNSGRIAALNGVAIDFQGDANDTLNVLSGSELNGTVDFGNGNDNMGGTNPDDIDTLNIGPGVNAEITFADNSGNDSDIESAPEIITGGATVVSLNEDGTELVIVDPTISAAHGASTNDVSNAIFNAITKNINAGDGASGQVTRLAFFPNDNTDITEKRAWGSWFGGHSEFDGSASLARYKNRHGGFIVGMERGTIETGGAFGFFGGYAQNTLEIAGGSSETNTNSLFAGAYLKRKMGVFDVNAALTFGINENKSERVVGLTTATGDFNGYFISPSVEISAPISPLKKLPVVASLGVNYTGLFLDGYTETGTGAPLTVGDNEQHFLGVRAELAAPFTYVNDDGAAISFDVRTGIDSEFSLGSGNVAASVAGTPFNLSGQADDNISGFLGFDLKYESLSGFSNVRVSAEAQSDFQDSFEVVGEVRVTFKF